MCVCDEREGRFRRFQLGLSEFTFFDYAVCAPRSRGVWLVMWNYYSCCSPFVLGVSTCLVSNDRKGSHTSLAVGIKEVLVEIMFPLREVLLVGYGG